MASRLFLKNGRQIAKILLYFHFFKRPSLEPTLKWINKMLPDTPINKKSSHDDFDEDFEDMFNGDLPDNFDGDVEDKFNGDLVDNFNGSFLQNDFNGSLPEEDFEASLPENNFNGSLPKNNFNNPPPHTGELNFSRLLSFRAEQLPKNSSTKLKTAVLVHDDPNTSFGISQEFLDETCSQKIESHCSNVIGSQESPSRKPGSYTEVKTPNTGTRLKRVFRSNDVDSQGFDIFSSQGEMPTSVAIPTELSDKRFTLVKLPTSDHKHQEIFLTLEDYLKIRAELDGMARSPTQKSVMGEDGHKSKASANNEAKLCSIEYDGNLEWTHLIAYFMRGPKGQIPANLVGATAPANTSMIFVEGQIPKLLRAYPKGIKINATAVLIPYTQFAKTIDYKIKIIQNDGSAKDFKQFQFDALRKEKPLIFIQDYTNAYIDASLMKKAARDQERSLQSATQSTLFNIDDSLSSLDENNETKISPFSTTLANGIFGSYNDKDSKKRKGDNQENINTKKNKFN